jgi:hypothetical protein
LGSKKGKKRHCMQPLKRNCIALNQELQNPERSYKALKQGKKEKRRKKEKISSQKKEKFS